MHGNVHAWRHGENSKALLELQSCARLTLCLSYNMQPAKRELLLRSSSLDYEISLEQGKWRRHIHVILQSSADFVEHHALRVHLKHGPIQLLLRSYITLGGQQKKPLVNDSNGPWAVPGTRDEANGLTSHRQHVDAVSCSFRGENVMVQAGETVKHSFLLSFNFEVEPLDQVACIANRNARCKI